MKCFIETKILKSFDETMVQAMPADALKSAWTQILTQAGAYQEQVRTTSETQEGYHIAQLTLRFERGDLLVRMIFNADGKLGGLHFRPAES